MATDPFYDDIVRRSLARQLDKFGLAPEDLPGLEERWVEAFGAAEWDESRALQEFYRKHGIAHGEIVNVVPRLGGVLEVYIVAFKHENDWANYDSAHIPEPGGCELHECDSCSAETRAHDVMLTLDSDAADEFIRAREASDKNATIEAARIALIGAHSVLPWAVGRASAPRYLWQEIPTPRVYENLEAVKALLDDIDNLRELSPKALEAFDNPLGALSLDVGNLGKQISLLTVSTLQLEIASCAETSRRTELIEQARAEAADLPDGALKTLMAPMEDDSADQKAVAQFKLHLTRQCVQELYDRERRKRDEYDEAVEARDTTRRAYIREGYTGDLEKFPETEALQFLHLPMGH